MRVYTVYKKNFVIGVFIVNDDNPPPDLVLTKLVARGYFLTERAPVCPRNADEWNELVCDTVRADQNLEYGFEWPEVEQ